MGWEKRGNNKYYYRKKREGKRVISIYFGKGEKAKKAHRGLWKGDFTVPWEWRQNQ